MEQKILSLTDKLRARIASIHELAPGSIGSQMNYEVIESDEEKREFTMLCRTFDWMRNIPGTLHGGMCATVVDQAMGFVAHCLKSEGGTAPTVQMSVEYLRPLFPGEDVVIRVKVVSVTRNLMRLSAEAALASCPAKICLTSTATYFNKQN